MHVIYTYICIYSKIIIIYKTNNTSKDKLLKYNFNIKETI